MNDKAIAFAKAIGYENLYEVRITSIRFSDDAIRITGFIRNKKEDKEYYAWIAMTHDAENVAYHCNCAHHLYTGRFCKHLAMLLLEANKVLSEKDIL